MAAGDELIDHFNQAYLKNRIIDGPVQVMFDGVCQTWKPGETRSISRAYVGHFLRGADIVKDPTNINPPICALALVDLTGALEAGTDWPQSLEPLTKAEVEQLSMYGNLDESNLAENRYVDDQGVPQNRREVIRVNRGFDNQRRALPSSREAVGPAIDAVADAMAR